MGYLSHCAACCTIALLLPSLTPGAAAQQPRLLPDRTLLPHLLADPREPTTLAKFVYVTETPNLGGTGLQGEAGFGVGLPVLRLAGAGERDALVVGVQGGVFGRFFLLVKERDLISTDWVFAVPVAWRRGDHWFRLRYLHTSAHLGDEYSERFQVSRVDFNRDVGEFLAFFGVGNGLGLYGGGGYAFNVDPDEAARWMAQTGAEYIGPALGAGLRFFTAVDVRLEQDRDWAPRFNAQTGLLMRASGRRDVRLAIELLSGPSPQGQFHARQTTLVTVGVYLDL